MEHKIWYRLSLIGAASVIAAACSSETGTTAATTSYVVPAWDTTVGLDSYYWDYGFYDPYYIYELVGIGQIYGGDGGITTLVDSGVLDGGLVSQSRIPRPLGGLFAAWGARIAANCAPQTDFVDADGDGIPASYNVTFNCTNQVSSDRTTTVTGTVAITDTNDASVTGGFSATFTNFVVNVVRNDGTTRNRTLNGTTTFAPGLNNTFQGTRNLTIAFVSQDPNQTQITGTLVSQETATYTPDSTATDPFAAGTVSLAGTSTLTRSFQGSNVTRVVTRSTNPNLHWNRSCRTQNALSSGFDSGTLIYRDDAGSTATIVYSGCGTPSVTAQ
jgi:hypothetical protein